MTGRRVPWTKSSAITSMMYDEYVGESKMKIKRQARREERRYLKETLQEAYNGWPFPGI